MLSKTIDTTNRMAHVSLQLYGLYLKLGHARSDKDLLLIKRTFGPQIKDCDFDSMSFTGKINYFEANVWYHYIQHNFVQSYRYACYWIELYKAYPEMQVLHYDNYINGYARMLDGLFLMRTYKRFKATLEEFERQEQTLTSICAVSELLYRQIEYLNRMNLHLFKGSFNEGVKLIPEIKQFIIENHSKISVHDEMLLQYKIASIYFGNQEYQ